MFLTTLAEPDPATVTMTVAVASFVVVALGWMARGAARSPKWPAPDTDDD